MSSTKRRMNESDAAALDSIDIGDEEMKALASIQKEQDRFHIVAERDTVNTLTPLWEKRRPIVAAIPKFWVQVLVSSPELSLHLQLDEDRDALGYLKDIHIIRNPDEFRAFTLEFHFNPNPYFHDDVIRKEYSYTLPPGTEKEETTIDGLTETMIDFNWERDVEAKAVNIKWKDDANNLVKKHPRNLPTEDEPKDEDAMDIGIEDRFGSFFNLFTVAEDDLGLGQILAEDVYPVAIDLFLQGPEFDEDVTDDDDDDDDDAEEIDLEAPRKKKGRKP